MSAATDQAAAQIGLSAFASKLGVGAMMPIPSLTGGAGGSAGPATGTAVDTITPAFDSSNWTVTTGGSRATASNASGAAGSLAGINWMYVGGAALVAYILWKKR